MLGRLFLLFTIVPTVELYLLIQIGERIGALETVWMVVLVGFLGAWLAKREGAGVLRALQQDLARGLPPADRVIEGLLVLVGSVLLITPGVLSDLAGILMLFPPTRRAMAPAVRRYLTKKLLGGGGGVTFRMVGFSGGVGGAAGQPTEPGPTPRAPSEGAQHPRFDHPLPEDPR